MYRASDGQGDLFSADTMYLELVGANSFYAFLAREGERLFPDEAFASFYCRDNGRPCVSPCMLTKVLLLQMFDRCSDQEAVDRSRFDMRWKVALRIRIEDQPFAKSTLQQHRARIHLNNWSQQLLFASVEEARRVGILRGGRIKACVDTTPVFGRGAVKDTFNLIADGITALCRALAKACSEKPEAWAARNDFSRYWEASSLKGEANIDWTNDDERRVFLAGLLADVDRALLIAQRVIKSLEQGSQSERAIEAAADLLRQLIAQDVDRGNNHGNPKIKQEVAKDRVISVHDPEMRHGHKSASNRFDGHKLAIAVEPESQIVTAVKVAPGNSHDAHNALDLVHDTEQATGAVVERTIGDCAYGDGATRQKFEDEKRELIAKVPSPPKDQPCHKARFQIDVDNNRVTCPAGHTTTDFEYVKSRDQTSTVKQFRFPAEVCRACPLFATCVANKKGNGRTVTLHMQEDLLQRARAYQASEAFLQDKRDRQAVEHRFARLVQLGIRQSRYFGRAKTQLQCVLAAVVANLTRVTGALAAAHRAFFRPFSALFPLATHIGGGIRTAGGWTAPERSGGAHFWFQI